jgi:hypothetical protein
MAEMQLSTYSRTLTGWCLTLSALLLEDPQVVVVHQRQILGG